jgi:coenzyme Q-binding protein COQ10
MPSLTIHRSIAHSWEELYALVLDVERYPTFVPCCTRVRILSRRNPTPDRVEIVSTMTVGLLPLRISYTNLTTADRQARRIGVQSTDGPLRHLEVVWEFRPLAPERTDVTLNAGYDFKSPVFASLAAGAFERLFSQIVDAFEHRADLLSRRAARAHG